MKSVLIFLLFILSIPAYAQECEMLGLFEQGASVTTVNYNGKGKEQSRVIAHTKKVSTINGVLTAEVHSELKEKDKVTATADYTVTCKNGIITIDASSLVPSETQDAYKDASGELKMVEAKNLEYPASMKAGQALEDGLYKAEYVVQEDVMKINGTLDMLIFNRKVVSNESLTTPAGTFDPWKITYDIKTSVKMIIPIRFELNVVEWFVPGLGPVKSETYRKGKLLNTTVLTEIK